jgi:fructosamine-3-kinase
MIDKALADVLCDKLDIRTLHWKPVYGGSINSCFALQTEKSIFFCKINNATKFPHLFEFEQKGLELIGKQHIIATPQVIECFESNNHQFLILEWIKEGERTKAFWENFGKQLAQLHHVSHNAFGLDHSNYIGAIAQDNEWLADWNSFFIQKRIMPLVNQCYDLHLLDHGHLRSFQVLYKRIADLFERSSAALLHGDLWSGNFMCNEKQQPVLIDPAVYFGHRSMDLGMTTLFGGFDQAFYEAYHYHFPLPPQHQAQWAVCNLYPLLIHLLLFGKTYLSSIESTLQEFQ